MKCRLFLVVLGCVWLVSVVVVYAINSEWKSPDPAMPYSHVTWLCEHNAHSSRGYQFPVYRQQDWTVTQGLEYGVRAFMLDTYDDGFDALVWLESEISKYGNVALGWTDDQIDKIIDEKTQKFLKEFPEAAVGGVIGAENAKFLKENGKKLARSVKKAAIKTVLTTAGKAEEVLVDVGLPAVDQLLARTDFVVSVVKDPTKSLEAAKEYGQETIETAQKMVNFAEKNAKDLVTSAVKIEKEAETIGKKAVKVLEDGWKKTEEAAKKTGEAFEKAGKEIKKGAEKAGKGIKKGAETVGKEVGSWFS